MNTKICSDDPFIGTLPVDLKCKTETTLWHFIIQLAKSASLLALFLNLLLVAFFFVFLTKIFAFVFTIHRWWRITFVAGFLAFFVNSFLLTLLFQLLAHLLGFYIFTIRLRCFGGCSSGGCGRCCALGCKRC